MKRFKKKTKFVLCFLVVNIIITSAITFYGISNYKTIRTSNLNHLTSIRSELGYETYDLSILNKPLSISNIVEKTKKIISLEFDYKNISKYQNTKQEIIKNFDNKVNEYKTQISIYNEINIDFVNIDLFSLDFQTKRNLDKYFYNLKAQFRKNIIEHNQTTQEKFRFEFDPEIEIKNLTIEQKVGLLFVFAFQGTSLSNEEAEFLKNKNIGGVVLLGENISDENQVRNLTNSIQNANDIYELFIQIDQEGDSVKRIWWDETPGLKQIANLNEEQACSEFTKRDELLSNLGINWNLGIVSDVTSDPNSFIYSRVFSGDYNLASKYTGIAIKCSPKTITTLKHYPGHGATELDTHQGLAIISKEEATWSQEDGKPFLDNLNSDSIMFGQLILPWLDNENPATLSIKNHEYIRQKGFENIIVTDDLRMLEAAGLGRLDILERALNAGNDVLLYSISDINEKNELVNHAIELVKSDKVSELDIDRKLIRILNAKNKIIQTNKNLVKLELVY